MPHTYTDTKPPTFREAQKQITLIFTVTIREQTFQRIVPLPRALASLGKAHALLALGRWEAGGYGSPVRKITVRQGDTEDVRQTRRTARWDDSLTPVLKNILERGES